MSELVLNITERTMWMIPRNIRRVEPWQLCQMITLMESIAGGVGSQEDQDRLYDELARLGIKAERGASGVANAGGFRTYLAQLACLGLYVKTSQGYELTRAGERMLKAQDPKQVLRCQLFRMQYPSVYGLGPNVKIAASLKVKPFVFLTKLLQDPRIGSLTSQEAAVAVIYGRTFADFEKCVGKILTLRQLGGSTKALESLIDDVSDVCTPKRRKGDDLLEKGCQDAKEIGNTFLNYLQGSALIQSSDTAADCRVLAMSTAEWQALVKPYEGEFQTVLPLDPAQAENWQRFYGRCDQTKGKRPSVRQKRRNGFESLIRSSYMNAVGGNPFGFDHAAFVTEQAQKWSKSETEVEAACAALKVGVRKMEHDALEMAAVSGGKQSLLLEKGVCNLFKRLGFDESIHTGNRKAAGRQGGFPDVYIKSSLMTTCGLADAKATARYGFDLGDQVKLSAYYKNCHVEIDPDVASTFFVYVAGGFDKSDATINSKIKECRTHYGRPVSAVTVRALLDLVEEGGITPQQLTKAMESGRYFNSASLIRQAAL